MLPNPTMMAIHHFEFKLNSDIDQYEMWRPFDDETKEIMRQEVRKIGNCFLVFNIRRPKLQLRFKKFCGKICYRTAYTYLKAS